MNINIFASDLHFMLVFSLLLVIFTTAMFLAMGAYVGLERVQLAFDRMQRRRDRKLPGVRAMTWLRLPKLNLTLTRQ